MSILVTGALGNVGNYVTKALLEMGESPILGDINPKALQERYAEQENVIIRRLDFTDINTFTSVLKGVTRVFLMRPPHLGNPEDLYPFIDAMKAQGVELVAFLSLMGVEKNTIPPHHKIEKYIESKGLPFAHVRPGFFMQNITGVHLEEIKKDSKIMIPAGNSQTSFIDAEDIGLAIAILLHEGKKYQNTTHTITGPEALNYHQIATILSEVSGRTIKYAKPGYLKYRNHYIKKRRLDKAYVNVTMALYFMTRMGTAKAVTDTFFELTGRKPTDFKTFAMKHKQLF